ncbi:MerR family transcriptional regulator [Bacillus sp. SRB1LM]|uniref:MerR family transcriptional regulator n=1 Tax=Bacillus sp. SRB1LM TaxID=2608688 RepID=UPI0018C3551A|nr:MerR family transcriptional regulator [Bacillus sp. SRB1LM]MBG0964058.1 MerR family transcriptional regulator [Bacillus sp. SRB1LM]
MNNVVSLERPKRLINSKDVANTLNISPSTLRTYTAHFRRCGYSFDKKKGKVLYTEQDLELLKRMIQLHLEGKGTITECIKSVLDIEDTKDTPVTSDNSAQVQQLEQNCKEIQTELAGLQEEMKKIKNYIDTRLEERDQLLVATLREVLQSKREKRKKKWWHIWKR